MKCCLGSYFVFYFLNFGSGVWNIKEDKSVGVTYVYMYMLYSQLIIRQTIKYAARIFHWSRGAIIKYIGPSPATASVFGLRYFSPFVCIYCLLFPTENTLYIQIRSIALALKHHLSPPMKDNKIKITRKKGKGKRKVIATCISVGGERYRIKSWKVYESN